MQIFEFTQHTLLQFCSQTKLVLKKSFSNCFRFAWAKNWTGWRSAFPRAFTIRGMLKLKRRATSKKWTTFQKNELLVGIDFLVFKFMKQKRPLSNNFSSRSSSQKCFCICEKTLMGGLHDKKSVLPSPNLQKWNLQWLLPTTIISMSFPS